MSKMKEHVDATMKEVKRIFSQSNDKLEQHFSIYFNNVETDGKLEIGIEGKWQAMSVFSLILSILDKMPGHNNIVHTRENFNENTIEADLNNEQMQHLISVFEDMPSNEVIGDMVKGLKYLMDE